MDLEKYNLLEVGCKIYDPNSELGLVWTIISVEEGERFLQQWKEKGIETSKLYQIELETPQGLKHSWIGNGDKWETI